MEKSAMVDIIRAANAVLGLAIAMVCAWIALLLVLRS
jgi:hypothetical protein